jgi:FKBP-type peptidyl-prolyl cis-trans isomerase SlyD
VKIIAGCVVTLEYRVHLGDGELAEGTAPGEPVALVQGRGQILPGLERALEGRSAGDVCRIVLPPRDAYGERDEEGLQEVACDRFPPGFEPRAGMELTARNERGEPVRYTVREVGPRTVVVDLNHPLAGETLHVEARVVAVRAARPDELEHGHAHEPGTRYRV